MTPRTRYLSTSLALVAVGLGYALIQGRPDRPPLRLPARPAAPDRPAPTSPSPPTAREILERARALSLTAAQIARLEALDRQWQQESSGLEAALRQAEQDFSRFMTDAQAARRTSLEEIERRSAEFRELSAALRERRRLHAEAAAQLLSEPQRLTLASLPSPKPTGGGR